MSLPAIAIAAVLIAVPSTTAADDDVARRFAWRPPARSYLWDGGAVPFLYVPLVVGIGVQLYARPPAEPRGFSRAEGGASYDGGQYPTPLLYVGAGAAALTIPAPSARS